MKTKLAIIIPAYKPDFFKETLESIANQTLMDFTLYIGDDASPFNLYSIVKPFENKIQIVYKKFKENLGGENLVGHWNRCIELAKDEEWIWLFSDDDTMDPDSVNQFYSQLSKKDEFDVYHFNTRIIDENSKVTDDCFFPEVLDSSTFLVKRLKVELNSFVVEYIFRKQAFYKKGRFQDFDLAWNSDDATWIKLASEKGIKTITNAYVYWRESSVNISSNQKDRFIALRKMDANILYYQWLTEKIIGELNIEKEELKRLIHQRYLNKLISKRRALSYSDLLDLVNKFHINLNISESSYSDFLKVSSKKLRTSIADLLKKSD